VTRVPRRALSGQPTTVETPHASGAAQGRVKVMNAGSELRARLVIMPR
jgi:hypothetical protein